jgi:hypothetical protein
LISIHDSPVSHDFSSTEAATGYDDDEVFLEAESPKEEIKERMKNLQLGFDRMKLKKKKASKYAKESIPEVINSLTAAMLIHEWREVLGVQCSPWFPMTSFPLPFRTTITIAANTVAMPRTWVRTYKVLPSAVKSRGRCF